MAADPTKAYDAVRFVLDQWRQGQTPASLQKQEPKITVVDEDWQDGRKLMGYALALQPGSDGFNAQVDVMIDLDSPQGVQQKVVQYRVTTSPIITVIRQDE